MPEYGTPWPDSKVDGIFQKCLSRGPADGEGLWSLAACMPRGSPASINCMNGIIGEPCSPDRKYCAIFQGQRSDIDITNSANSEFAHANQDRVNRRGLFTSYDSCMRPVPASVDNKTSSISSFSWRDSAVSPCVMCPMGQTLLGTVADVCGLPNPFTRPSALSLYVGFSLLSTNRLVFW